MRNAEIAPPNGSVPYVVARPREFAFASWRRGTRFGSEASRAGVQIRASDSITNDTAKIAHTLPRNGIEP